MKQTKPASRAETLVKVFMIYSISCLRLRPAIDLKNSSGSLHKGPYSGKVDVTFTVSDGDFMEVVQGKLNPQKVTRTWISVDGAYFSERTVIGLFFLHVYPIWKADYYCNIISQDLKMKPHSLNPIFFFFFLMLTSLLVHFKVKEPLKSFDLIMSEEKWETVKWSSESTQRG